MANSRRMKICDYIVYRQKDRQKFFLFRKNDYLCRMKNIAFHHNNSGAALIGLTMPKVCKKLKTYTLCQNNKT